MNKLYSFYLQATGIFILLWADIGLLIPYLISQKNDLAFALGIVVIVLTGLFILWVPQYYQNKFKKGISNEENQTN